MNGNNMTKPVNLAVFPCGSEVALEIHRSLANSIHCNLFGLSSVDDHGKFVYKNYIGGLPFIDEINFIPRLTEVIKKYKIDAIYPAMDQVITILKRNEKKLGCNIIASALKATEICLSKSGTYAVLKDVIPTPRVYPDADSIETYPVFLKPDTGYGSRGVKKAQNKKEVKEHQKQHPDVILLEYLPGNEYTIDCFTNYRGELLFAGPRQRNRVSNGISVNTATMASNDKFKKMALQINKKLKLDGAWFFQMKERSDGTLVLMEVASRMAGSSGVYRAKGVNFALLSLFNAYKIPVSIIVNNYEVEMDRALDNHYKISMGIDFNYVYIDYDDTIIVNNLVNTKLIALLYHFINKGKKILLITKHKPALNESLNKYRLKNIFDKIIHLKEEENKWEFIEHKDAIFIDDSFAERESVYKHLHIPVFSEDMIEALL